MRGTKRGWGDEEAGCGRKTAGAEREARKNAKDSAKSCLGE